MRKIALPLFLSLCAVSAFSQNAAPLDAGFAASVKYFEGRIAGGTKIVVFNFRSQSPKLSEYLMEELTVHFVNSGTFTVVDRSNLELLQQELAFQLSGEVSDEAALSVGKKLGAEIVVSGSFEPLGDIFRLRVRAIAVESAAIQGIYTANIQKDRFFSGFIETSPPVHGKNDPAAANPPANAPPSAPSRRSVPATGNTGSVSLPDYLLSK